MNNKVRIIKMYQNRKLYDTLISCYVTLDELAQIIREGNEVKVINNKYGEDITYNVFLQILHQQERKSNERNLDLLTKVIRSDSGAFTGVIKELASLVPVIEEI